MDTDNFATAEFLTCAAASRGAAVEKWLRNAGKEAVANALLCFAANDFAADAVTLENVAEKSLRCTTEESQTLISSIGMSSSRAFEPQQRPLPLPQTSRFGRASERMAFRMAFMVDSVQLTVQSRWWGSFNWRWVQFRLQLALLCSGTTVDSRSVSC